MTSTLTSPEPSRAARADGFSLVDMLVVVAVVGVVAASAVPMTASATAAYRLKNDAQAVNNLVKLAKMRAASRFTRARVYVDIAANTYRLEIFDRTTDTWVTETAVTGTSRDVTFGFSGLASAPPDTQVTIAMSSECTDNAGATVADTSCIVFNSRGVPISMVAPVGDPLGNNAFYLTDGIGVYATTVTATPLVRAWWSPASAAHWTQQ